MREKKAPRRHLLCVKNDGYPASLEVRKIYQTLADPQAAKRGLVRVVDESGDDYLYPKNFFVSIALPKAASQIFRLAG
jgi:hypothetical protein